MISDLKKRSLLKGISWRFFATIDTFLISFFFFKKISIALPIALTEVFSKLLLYYLHERGWNLIKLGRKENVPTHFRSISKGITWRIIGSLDTFLISLFYSNDFFTSLNISSTEILTKIILFYLHERIWSLIKWGRIIQAPPTYYTSKITSL